MTTGAVSDIVILDRGRIVNSVWIVFAVGVVLAGVGFVPAVYGQEAKPPADIRMLLSQPQNRVGVDATAGPDLRDLPPPKMDKPPVVPPVRITVGDPHCRPGEDSPEGLNGISRSRRSR
jgi:hypothetical protein